MTALQKALEALNEFCLREYGYDEDFTERDNLSRLDIAYTTVTDYELELQVYVDLKKYRIVYELDDEYYCADQFKDLEDITGWLEVMDFNDCIPYVPEDDAKVIYGKRVDYNDDWKQSDFI